jgi:hypothetical protein
MLINSIRFKTAKLNEKPKKEFDIQRLRTSKTYQPSPLANLIMDNPIDSMSQGQSTQASLTEEVTPFLFYFFLLGVRLAERELTLDSNFRS